ncbi:MAG: Nif3-like dinuclear metal center hexameric protein [Phycisphaerales bacterium]|jgi:dinuclear metal center YbgI/SA1388 family protein|nr:Nif3-like dinuclear metal center hexameric protein [Phycisphaerales bacterium]
MIQVSHLVEAMERIAPTQYAEAWDNVGLLVGDPHQKIRRILLTIDYTRAVAAEVRQKRCDAVVAYHPPIFNPLKRLPADNLIFDAISRGVAIYSPHTALDVADGGTNDLLADVLGLENRAPLRQIEPKSIQYKLVTFVPRDHLDSVSKALFNAGAGQIGDYSHCSFRSAGTGTFFGQPGTNPAVGRRGHLEQVDEVRLETIVPISKIQSILSALRTAHPYEEPAYDLLLTAPVSENKGQGRIGDLKPIDRRGVIQKIKKTLGLKHLLVAGPTTGTITRAAVCAGSCGDLLQDARNQKAQLYLTGEMRHHDALLAAQEGMTIVCTLHSNSERAVLKRLQQKLLRELRGIKIIRSQNDADPFKILP